MFGGTYVCKVALHGYTSIYNHIVYKLYKASCFNIRYVRCINTYVYDECVFLDLYICNCRRANHKTIIPTEALRFGCTAVFSWWIHLNTKKNKTTTFWARESTGYEHKNRCVSMPGDIKAADTADVTRNTTGSRSRQRLCVEAKNIPHREARGGGGVATDVYRPRGSLACRVEHLRRKVPKQGNERKQAAVAGAFLVLALAQLAPFFRFEVHLLVLYTKLSIVTTLVPPHFCKTPKGVQACLLSAKTLEQPNHDAQKGIPADQGMLHPGDPFLRKEARKQTAAARSKKQWETTPCVSWTQTLTSYFHTKSIRKLL